MKVFFVIATLKSGGAERVITNLANSFAEAGHEPFVVYFDEEKPFYSLHSKVKLERLFLGHPTNKFQSLLLILKLIFLLSKKIRRNQPHVVISFITLTNIISILATRFVGVPIIISERISLLYREPRYIEMLRKRCYKFADAIVFQTHRIIDSYREEKIGLPLLTEVIKNPLPPVFQNNYKVANKRENIVLAVGRLEYQKGFDLLIKAFSAMERNDWSLQIVGEGPRKAELMKLAAESKGRIEFLGRRTDIAEIYSRASVFVLSSRFEGYPNALCEAMASGCACISFNCDFGPAEIVKDKENGILINEIDEFALSDSLKKLINDDALRTRLGNEALKIRDELSILSVTQEWYDIVHQVVSNKK